MIADRNPRRILASAVIMIVVLALAACGSAPTREPTVSPDDRLHQSTSALLAAGRGAEAARQWLDAADRSRSPVLYRLYAAHSLLAAGDNARARALIEGLDGASMSDLERDLASFALAELARNEGRYRQAQAYLAAPESAYPDWLERRLLLLQADIYANNDAPLAAARALSTLIDLDPDRSLATQAQLIELLGRVPPPEMNAALAAATDANWAGWLELMSGLAPALLAGAYIEDYVEAWQRENLAHPAHPGLLDELTIRYADTTTPLASVAVILPASGRLNDAATAIRDGIVAAWFDLPQPRPLLRFYDEASGDIQDTYAQALNDGASHVIGPLDRSAVARVAERGSLPAPTLALNESTASAANLFQFALAPEDDAHSVAHRAWADGHSRALVILPSGEWGDRVYVAFKERFEALGGHITYDAALVETERDFSQPLRRLLGVDASEQRHRELEQVLRQDLGFEPQRRPDADFVFMALRPTMARLVRPQLQFHQGQDLPVYATSHAYTGEAEPERNRDLNGVIFCDAPWLIDHDARTAATFASASGPAARLFALGRDAMRVLPMLGLLHRQGTVEAHTGTLSVAEDGRIQRSLACARFEGGVPVALTTDGPSATPR